MKDSRKADRRKTRAFPGLVGDPGPIDLNDDAYKNKRLLPARHVRMVQPHCCATCRFHIDSDGFALCRRIGGWEDDTGDGLAVYHVCDGWRKIL